MQHAKILVQEQILDDEGTNRKSAIKIMESLLDMPIVEKILETKREGGATCVHDVAATGSANVLQLLLEKMQILIHATTTTALHCTCLAHSKTQSAIQQLSLYCAS